MMVSRDELPSVRKVEVLGDQESPLTLCGVPDVRIWMSCWLFFENGMDVMTQISEDGTKNTRNILIQFEIHRMRGVSGVGKSSSAEAAAKAIAA
jgi:hypothetical protein